MSNCAFIDVFTTMNDLYGSNNCPIQFRCEVQTWEELMSGSSPQSKQLNMVPDEAITGNGTAYHGYSNAMIEKIRSQEQDGCKTWLDLKDGLSKIKSILSFFSKQDIYFVGYGLNSYILNTLDASFRRILGEGIPEISQKKLIDVETLSKRLVDVRKCGNYSKNSILASLENVPFACSCEARTLKIEISKTRRILTELICVGNLSTGGHMGSLEEVAGYLSAPEEAKRFPMGKYKGMSIAEAYEKDRQYFSWMLKNRKSYDSDPDVMRAVSRIVSEDI